MALLYNPISLMTEQYMGYRLLIVAHAQRSAMLLIIFYLHGVH